MTASVPAGFRGAYRADEDARAVYSEAAGIERIWPRAVAVPVDIDDLGALVRWAESTETPLIPRGSGSSMPNGAIGDGVIVDLSRWRSIGTVDVASKTIRVGPGVLRAEVDRVARSSGLRFPVDPSSGTFCTVGGMAATNAAGSHSMRFGAMRPWVRAATCVFSDGSSAELRRGADNPSGVAPIDRFFSLAPRFDEWKSALASAHAGVIKDSSGYGLRAFFESGALVDLMVGSEGTLAFFAELELDLVPVAKATSSVLGAFDSIEAAVVAAQRAREVGAVTCELLDRTFLDVAASEGATRRTPPNTESALLAEVEAADASEAGEAALLVERIFQESGAIMVRVALDAPTETELWELRHAASPILARLGTSLRSMQFVEDCAVPPEHMAEFVRHMREILAKHETRGVIFGHAGDSHVHVNPLIDMTQAGWRERVDSILDAVTTLTASLGGTLAGEHGDGRLRAPLMDRVWPPAVVAAFRESKAAFDPRGILNPGAIVATEGERPLGDIKYDPALPSLPPRARVALESVARDRAYASFRLELLQDAN